MNAFIAGNQIELLRNGRAYFPALAAAIEQAKQTIYLQTYIFEVDAAGKQIADALKAAAQRGVTVRVLLDGFGCKDMPDSFVKAFKKSGAQLMFYRPKISPWSFKKNRLRRMHRKVAVIDETIGFVGGINIIDDSNVPEQLPPRVDYAVRVEGALLPSMTASVQKLWRRIKLTHLEPQNLATDNATHLPKTVKKVTNKNVIKSVSAAFLLRDNFLHRRDIETAYLKAINAAKTEIIIANAYFLPGRRFRQALIKAANRGVAVQLLLQGRMEYFLMPATHAFYSMFLKSGIAIFEYRKSYMHCKVAVIDGTWATVGSSNIDPFSMLLAREANIMVQDSAFASELRAEILQSIHQQSVPVSAQEWLKRNKLKRAMSWLTYGMVKAILGMIGYSNER
ncbi:Cls Phosphatidylserine/phosphatidylglycerophosphate/ cardiolipin synthases and related enzymes [Methylophilaceae bacterium]